MTRPGRGITPARLGFRQSLAHCPGFGPLTVWKPQSFEPRVVAAGAEMAWPASVIAFSVGGACVC